MLAEIPVHRPDSLDEALALLAAPPQEEELTVLAGGTDLMVLLNARSSVPQRVLDIWKLDALRGIRMLDDGRLEVGALSTYCELIASSLVQGHSPALVEASKTVGAVQIQARGTLGGNVANASPAGDTLPVLLAQGAEVVLVSRGGGERSVDFASFYKGYRQPDIREGELIQYFRIDPLPVGGISSFRKVGTRLAQAISKVMIAGVGVLDGQGRVAELRLAVGSVAPTPVRLPGAELAALGKLPREAAAAVAAATPADIAPIDDVRSNAAYRREVTARLAARFVLGLESTSG